MGKLPDGWQLRVLGDIAIDGGLQTGPFGSQLKASEYSIDGIPVVMPSDLANYRISTTSIARIPAKRAEELNKHQLQIGDIVFGRRGDIGRCAVVTESEQGWICGTGCLRVRLSLEKALSDFVIQYLDLPQAIDWLRSNAVGQTMLNLNTLILSELPLYLPPLLEQRKIAEILSTWDEAIALVEALIAALKARKKGLMQRLLTGAVRFPGFVESDEVLETKFGNVPVDWTLTEIENVAVVNAENADTDPTKEWLYIDLSAVDQGNVELPIERMSYSELPSRAQRVLHQNDVIMATVRPNLLGYAICDFYPIDILCSTGFALISPNDSDDATFIYQNLYGDTVQRQIHGMVTGSNYPAINSSEVRQLKIAFPKVPAERAKIANVLTHVDKQVQNLNAYAVHFREQKKGLMQRLLTGEVRVRVEE